MGNNEGMGVIEDMESDLDNDLFNPPPVPQKGPPPQPSLRPATPILDTQEPVEQQMMDYSPLCLQGSATAGPPL